MNRADRFRVSSTRTITALAVLAVLVASSPAAALAGQRPGAAGSLPGRIDSPPKPGNRSVTGRVVSTITNRPVAGATVHAIDLRTGTSDTTHSSPSGAFSMRMALPSSHPRRSSYQISVRADGYFSTVTHIADQGHASLMIALGPDRGIVAGMVRWADGRPASNLPIRLVSEATGATRRLSTGAKGQFALSAPALPSRHAIDTYELIAGAHAQTRRFLRIAPGRRVHAVLTLPQHGGSGRHQLRALDGPVQPTPVPSCPSQATKWTGSAGDGQWETAGNWSNGEPSATVYACISKGTATVTVHSSASAAGLLLGKGDSLQVQSGGLTLGPSGAPSALRGALSVGNGAAVTVTSGALLLNASGGSIVNHGSLWVSGSFEQDAGAIASAAGDVPVDLLDGSRLTFAGTGPGAFRVFDPNAQNSTYGMNLAGNLVSGQSLDIEVSGMTYGVTPVTTVNAARSFTNGGTITVGFTGGFDHDGNVHAELKLPSGASLVNTGTLTLANAPNGAAGPSIFTGNLTNQGGAINIGSASGPASLEFAAGDTVLNQGAITIGNSSEAAVAIGATLKNQAGGLITNGNQAQPSSGEAGLLVAGHFEQDAGKVASGSGNGPVDLLNGSSIRFGGTGAGAFEAFDPNAQNSSLGVEIAGDIAAGQSLDVEVQGFTYGVSPITTVTAKGGFVNAGMMTIGFSGGFDHDGNAHAELKLPAGATLVNSGTLAMANAPTNGAAGPSIIYGSLTNKGGSVSVGTASGPASLEFAGGDTIRNQGSISVATGSALTLEAGTRFFNQAGGLISSSNDPLSENGGVGFMDAGAFEQDAGRVASGASDAPVDLLDGASLHFRGTGAGAFEVFDPTLSSQSPTITLSGNIAKGQSLQAVIEGFDYGRGPITTINASASFSNAGTISVAYAGGFDHDGNAHLVLSLPTGGTLTNTGTVDIPGAAGNGALGANILGANLINQGSFTAGQNSQTTVNGDVTNLGVISVASPAQVAVAGNLTDLSSSTTRANVLATPSGAPLITVQGTVHLGGTLDFQTDPQAQLSSGQTFQLLNGGSVVNAFDYVTGLFIGSDLVYDVTQGASTLTASVTSETASPEAFRLNPSAGPAGSVVTIFGSALLGTTKVAFGSKNARSFTVISSTEVQATAPPGAAGSSVPVTVTTANGTSPTVGAPKYIYATKASGSAGSASLRVTVDDSTGHRLPNVTVGVADASTRNPLGLMVTDRNGTGTVHGLSTGATVEVSALGTPAPYGPTRADFVLSGGQNLHTLTLAVEPLVSSESSARTPDGTALAIWPRIVPQPGTPVPGGGSLSSNATLADLEFSLQWSQGDRLTLSGDTAGTKGFCVDGSWSLVISGPAPATTQHTLSGSGCPAAAGPIDLPKALGLTPGSYGGELTLTAPAGATTAGATDIYLLPVAGKVSNLRVTPGSLISHAQLGGSATTSVGQSTTLAVTLGGLPQPGITGYHAIFGFDPAGITITGASFPTGWGGGVRNNFANGDGGFGEGTSSSPENVGATVLSFEVTCDQAGIWPISFSGDYWLAQSNAGYADAVEGSATVVCNPPPPSSTTNPIGVSIDPTDGSVSLTVTGSNLGGAAKAKLLNSAGSLTSTSNGLEATDSSLTAHFPAAPAGLYDLQVTDAQGKVLAQTSGTPFEVSPALPQFGIAQTDILSNVPGISAEHIFRVTNTGTVDGVAVIAFTFPSYVSPEPFSNLAGGPQGPELLVHGKTHDGWVEYAAIPVPAGQSADVTWGVDVPPDAVFGTRHSAAVGMPVVMVTSLVGQFTETEWQAGDSNLTANAIVDNAFKIGLSDYTLAAEHILALPAADQPAYLEGLPDGNQRAGLTAFMTGLTDAGVLADATTHGRVTVNPSPKENDPEYCGPGYCIKIGPGHASNAPQPGDTLKDPMASFFGNFTRNAALATDAGLAVDSEQALGSMGASAPLYTLSAKGAYMTVGAGEAFHTGYLVTQASATASDTAKVDTVTALGDPGVESVDASAWTAGMTSMRVQAGAKLLFSALPFEQHGLITLDERTKVGNAHDNVAQVTFVGESPSPGSAGTPPASASHGSRSPYASAQGVTGTTGVINVPPSPCDAVAGQGGAKGIGWTLFKDAVGLGLGLLIGGPVGVVVSVIVLVSPIGPPGFYGSAGNALSAGAVGSDVMGLALASLCPPVVTSQDPNDIRSIPAGARHKGWIVAQPMTYRVDFYNEPKATAPAFNVEVKLHLDSHLDPASVQPGPSSFPGTEFTFDQATRTVTWILPNIDLPPDTNPPNGEAWVSFMANPKAHLRTGTKIRESASVFFDYNPPITTPTSLNTIDAKAPKIKLHVGKRSGGVIHLKWKSTRKVPLQLSEVFVSVGGRRFQPVTQTRKLKYTFHVKQGKKYRFFVRAVDVAGLSSKAPPLR